MGKPTVLDAPDGLWWWSPRWLPDGRALLVQGEDGNVWRISSRPGIRPVEVTEALPPNNEVWDFQISPDGRFMAYGRSIFRGSSIWRIGMGDALRGHKP
jgi:dipeptidyl aminopeptidase/acylaminoacyl peptidase